MTPTPRRIEDLQPAPYNPRMIRPTGASAYAGEMKA